MKEIELTTIAIKRSDWAILENFKDHPRQPIHEVMTEVLNIVTKIKRGSL